MNVQNVNNINFQAQMPKKQTFNAMKKYYKSIGDKEGVEVYANLENIAKARLHNRKSILAQEKIFDMSEKLGEEPLHGKDLFKYIIKQAKNVFNVIKETVLCAYYSAKKV